MSSLLNDSLPDARMLDVYDCIAHSPMYRRRTERPNWTYVIGSDVSSLVKIGRTRVSIEKRMRDLSTMSPVTCTFRLVGYIPYDCEGRLHTWCAKQRRHGEWFDNTDDEVVNTIKQFYRDSWIESTLEVASR